MSNEAQTVKVLFIGGWGRSGSTLLERMLGQVRGFFPVGEIYHVWLRGFSENQLCSCGNAFHLCDFWRAVAEEAFGSIDNVNISEAIALRQSVDRLRFLPQLLFPSIRGGDYENKFQKYAQLLASLYSAIKKVSNCEVIVDSSKEPTHGFVLHAMAGVDLSTVHLVRDSRGVAHSWQRRKLKPEIHWKKEYIRRYTPARSAFEWNLRNIMVDLLNKLCNRSIRISYEHLVHHPRATLTRIISELTNLESDLDFFEGKKVRLGTNHTVSGNPSRFQTGMVELRADLEWTKKMKIHHRFIVTFLTWPLLLAYGYSL
jgi:hypothetical protein